MPKKIGICINFGGCDKAKAKEKQEVEATNFVCEKCGKPLRETGPDSKGPNKTLIGGIAAAVIVLGGIGAYFGGAFGGENKGDADSSKNGAVMVVDSTTISEAEVNDAVTDTEEQQTTSETAGKDAETNIKETPTPVATANLDWASYEGPTSGGKPHGAGGELTVKSNHSIDLKNGSALDVNPGDKIKNTKFTNGVLRQGELQRKNGERKYFNIG